MAGAGGGEHRSRAVERYIYGGGVNGEPCFKIERVSDEILVTMIHFNVQ